MQMERILQVNVDLFGERDEYLFGRFRLQSAASWIFLTVRSQHCTALAGDLTLYYHVEVLSTLAFLATGHTSAALTSETGVNK